MKLLITIIFALFAAAGIGLILREDPGYTLISMGTWTIETSVAVLVVFLVIAFVVLYFLVRLILGILFAPSRAFTANRHYQVRRSYRLLAKGLGELIEGRWKAAEITLLKGAEHSKAPALHYAGAARAAQQLKEPWRRDGYLHKAEDLPGTNGLVGKLSRAEMLLENHEPAAARSIVLALYKGPNPHHPRVLELLARSNADLGEWQKVRELLPDLGKYGPLTDTAYTQLQLQTYSESLTHVAHTGTQEDLQRLWREVPEPLRTDDTLLLSYAGYLRDHHAPHEAETLLREALNQRWSDPLVIGYGEIGRGNTAAQLATAEGWLTEHPQDPYLLLTCGRLARRSNQPDKARTYLEQSLKALVSPDAYQELGEVLEEANDHDGARQCYHAALRLLSGRLEDKEGAAVLATGGESAQIASPEPPSIAKPTEQPSLVQDPQPSAS
ncbi:MAG: heme biosynthesis HemY N-terminal domain-containing protein [Candidatus Competibacteraceae bacterium]|jgi:HemY protein|nr:heme biosynthesis HemY N-terminal domain-containing protein [Candidatus Competibacteraceae bacterium]